MSTDCSKKLPTSYRENTRGRIPYTPPNLVIYGDVNDLTKANGGSAAHDSDFTQGNTPVSH